MEPLVSVIIPVYNAEEYLDKCIRSVLSQTYKNTEIILINDGSTDRSMELCEIYALNEKNIKLFSQQNSGASSARNVGLTNSTGDYIVFVDSDDWIMPTYIEDLYNSLIEYSADMIIVDYFIERDSELIYRKKQGLTNVYTNIETLNNIFDKDKYMGYLWNKIYQAEIIKGNNIVFNTELRVWEDLLFCCQYISKINKIVYIQKPIYVYLERKNSLTKNTSFDVQKSLLLAMQNIMELTENSSSKFSIQTGKVYATACIDRIFMEFRKREFSDRSVSEKLELAKPFFIYLTAKNKIKYICLEIIPKTIFLLITFKSNFTEFLKKNEVNEKIYTASSDKH